MEIVPYKRQYRRRRKPSENGDYNKCADEKVTDVCKACLCSVFAASSAT